MASSQQPNFNDTEKAFAYKSNPDLVRTYEIFRLINLNWLVRWGTAITSRLLDAGFRRPIAMVMQPTIYSVFCGGRSLEDAKRTIDKLYKHGVETILDYGVEGKETEEDFEKTAAEVLRAIHIAAAHPAVNHISSKFTGLVQFTILEKLHAGQELTAAENREYQKAISRIDGICSAAAEAGVRIFVDAEESWIQHTLDHIVEEMMQKYNRDKPIIFGTAQLYLKSRMAYLQDSIEKARKEGYVFAAKLVRGAYMDKERERAKAMGYPDPVQQDKSSTDIEYDAALELALNNLDHIAVCVATHNEESCQKATVLMREKGIPADHPHVTFSQLLGMSDHISFNLAAAGYTVSKYMPYGPVSDVIPYLIRRAQENTSVSGQMGRELSLLKKEIRRRKLLVP